MFRKLMEWKKDREYNRMRDLCELLARNQVGRITGLTLVCHEDAWNLVKDLRIFEQVGSDRVEKREDGLLGVVLSPVQLEALMLRVSTDRNVWKSLGPHTQGLSHAQFSVLYRINTRIVDALVDDTDWKRPVLVKPVPSVVYVHHPDGDSIETPSEPSVDAS